MDQGFHQACDIYIGIFLLESEQNFEPVYQYIVQFEFIVTNF